MKWALIVLAWIAMAGNMGQRECWPQDVACVHPPRPIHATFEVTR